jgi:YD repeat-containing protein
MDQVIVMKHSRRKFVTGMAGLAVLSGLAPSHATAETVQYVYDAQGRLVRAVYSTGVVVDYSYDAANNRTQIVRAVSPPPTPPAPFNQTIAITGASPVNLRTLANAAGYSAAQDANIIYTLAAGITITGIGGVANVRDGGFGIDTGAWPTNTRTIALTVQISGSVRGGGGVGGAGGVSAGGIGGDAIFCRLPLAITINSGGSVRGGGGGGGGGASSEIIVGGEPYPVGGGGGGGGFPNGAGGTGDPPAGSPGAAGTNSGGGAGGAGSGGGSTAGGAGGNAGNAGVASAPPGLAGGAAGYAIRTNGFAVAFTNNGSINGAVG